MPLFRKIRNEARLLQGLSVPKAQTRWQAAGALGSMGSESAVDPLIDLLMADPNQIVRGTAAAALGAIGSLRALPALAAALEDAAENVRRRMVAGAG